MTARRSLTAHDAAMASLPVYDSNGKTVGSYEIDPSDLAPRISKQLLHDAVVMYRANLRQGTMCSKTRSEVAGTTKKMYRQKGTGNARAGSRTSGVRRGGGHIFAKRPRDFGYRMPRKSLQQATRMALASKLQDSQITVIDQLSFQEPQTKSMAAVLKALGLSGKSLLVTTEQHNPNVYLSARNIARVSVSPANELNALSVLTPGRILITRAALDWLKSKAAESRSRTRLEGAVSSGRQPRVSREEAN